MDYPAFAKVPRLNRDVVITEKIDGTNGLIYICDRYAAQDIDAVILDSVGPEGWCLFAGSRSRWVNPADDNHGFAEWAHQNAEALYALGLGRHYGEWWGSGIQRGYNLKEKRFSLFNVSRWQDEALPDCLDVVPTIMRGNASKLNWMVEQSLTDLRNHGSFAAPGYMRPEGIVVYHSAGNHLYKVTLEGDEQPKTAALPVTFDEAEPVLVAA